MLLQSIPSTAGGAFSLPFWGLTTAGSAEIYGLRLSHSIRSVCFSVLYQMFPERKITFGRKKLHKRQMLHVYRLLACDKRKDALGCNIENDMI
jgi:hypothetical protein